MIRVGGLPPFDWRDRKIYQSLLSVDRAGWAWEWLRRNERYVAIATALPPLALCVLRQMPLVTLMTVPGQNGGASPWGLHFRGTTAKAR